VKANINNVQDLQAKLKVMAAGFTLIPLRHLFSFYSANYQYLICCLSSSFYPSPANAVQDYANYCKQNSPTQHFHF